MFAENLIQLRKLNHMSQDELADQIGVSRQTLSKYETGESLPDIDYILSLKLAVGNMRQGNPCRISKGAKGSQISLA